jgi:hypothetical protein
VVYIIKRKLEMKNELRPTADYPIYPPYHTGLYLEEYFYDKYKDSNREYIDIFWTNLYCNKDYLNSDIIDIQKALSELDPNKKYFTVCQHDDGPKENLPEDTLIFSAGGRRTHGNIIPIPLICSPIPKELIGSYIKKDLFASFVGSLTHNIREKLYYELKDKEGYSYNMCNWSNTVPQENLKYFIDISLRSKFVLCPRGYGPTSFRLYEAFQLNSVPVYISDIHYLPWVDELNWAEFCVIINEEDISNIDTILKSISDEDYNKMLIKGATIYNEYFSLSGVYSNIMKRL